MYSVCRRYCCFFLLFTTRNEFYQRNILSTLDTMMNQYTSCFNSFIHSFIFKMSVEKFCHSPTKKKWKKKLFLVQVINQKKRKGKEKKNSFPFKNFRFLFQITIIKLFMLRQNERENRIWKKRISVFFLIDY